MRRIGSDLAYDGGSFHGWQVQPGLPTIQGTLEEIISGIEGKPVQVAGSGRTDAGVHALAQVAAFSLENPIPLRICKRVNRLLPPAIRVLMRQRWTRSFTRASMPGQDLRVPHRARRSLLARSSGRTCFTTLIRWTRSAWWNWRAFWRASTISPPSPPPDDRDAEGGPRCGALFSSVLERGAGRLTYRVRGSGFLKHMVRNVVGTLIEAGKGNIDDCSRLPEKCGADGAGEGPFSGERGI